MASTTAWTAGTPSEGRRRRFAAAALTLAFFLTGSAVARSCSMIQRTWRAPHGPR